MGKGHYLVSFSCRKYLGNENYEREIPKDIQKWICLYLCNYYRCVDTKPKVRPEETLEVKDQNTPTLQTNKF